jgi:hypothetical protein
MKKSRLKIKKDRDEKFSKIGDKQIKQIKSEPKPLIISKEILYNEKSNQFSIKIPKEIMNNLNYKKGDEIKFILEFPRDVTKEPELKMEYKRK